MKPPQDGGALDGGRPHSRRSSRASSSPLMDDLLSFSSKPRSPVSDLVSHLRYSSARFSGVPSSIKPRISHVKKHWNLFLRSVRGFRVGPIFAYALYPDYVLSCSVFVTRVRTRTCLFLCRRLFQRSPKKRWTRPSLTSSVLPSCRSRRTRFRTYSRALKTSKLPPNLTLSTRFSFPLDRKTEKTRAKILAVALAEAVRRQWCRVSIPIRLCCTQKMR